jgi:hypothetical protein
VNSAVDTLLVATNLMKALLVISLTSVVATTQLSDGLRRKYGAPVSESYLVRPGILATFNYSKDGAPCSAKVAGQTDPKFTTIATAVDNDLMRTIVDELVPKNQRGKLVNSGFLNLTCVRCDSFYGSEEDYELVTITIGGPTNEKQTASIQWVGRSCER